MSRVDQVKAYQHTSPEQQAAAMDVIGKILARSRTDRPFREQLLANPRAAIAQFAGKKESEIPESFNLVFIENEAGATIVLPDPVSSDELAEMELESVSGGTEGWIIAAEITMAAMFVVDTIGKIWDNSQK